MSLRQCARCAGLVPSAVDRCPNCGAAVTGAPLPSPDVTPTDVYGAAPLDEQLEPTPVYGAPPLSTRTSSADDAAQDSARGPAASCS